VAAELLPRLDGEPSKAHSALLAYAALGPGRSLARVGSVSVSRRQLERWSTRYAWQQRVQRYDDAVAAEHIKQAAAAYLADVEAHRKRYKQAGDSLYRVAIAQLQLLAERLTGDEAGRIVVSLSTIANTLVIAADLEAHALQLGPLLHTLDERQKPDET
jgi:hypothetical protein